jgi:hypothetical protein
MTERRREEERNTGDCSGDGEGIPIPIVSHLLYSSTLFLPILGIGRGESDGAGRNRRGCLGGWERGEGKTWEREREREKIS